MFFSIESIISRGTRHIDIVLYERIKAADSFEQRAKRLIYEEIIFVFVNSVVDRADGNPDRSSDELHSFVE